MNHANPEDFKIEALADHHDRVSFTCGVEPLDRYLQKQAARDLRKKVAAVFVLTPDNKTIAGFYTLSAHSVRLQDLPPETARQLPRYPLVPATLLGRLALSEDFRGLGLGELLLMNALKQALAGSYQIASAAVVVDAKDEPARKFYLHYNFIPLSSQPNRLFCPMKTIEELFGP